jgi:UDP-N-acetylmuramate--alanine ligase
MNIYFSGIGGVGIGPLAEMAIDAGYHVQGSDRTESPITTMLRSRGIAIDLGQDGAFLEACHNDTPIDWFVHTAALPNDHPELVLARKLGIRIAKRDELLAHIIKEKKLKLIAVSGTHGKTTTTGMLIWIFTQLGIPASYSVGTTLGFGPSGKFDPKSEHFIYECDEFDRNFLHFQPTLSILPSIDYDHSDVYSTKKAYLEAFRQFIDQSDMTIMWQRDNADGIGATASDGWILGDDEVIDLRLPGIHYRQNGTLTVKAIEYLKLADTDSIIEILNRFPGTDRRFERLGDNLYSDYGHHPSEIKAMLQLAREISDHVVLIYQPHQNIRQHEVRGLYANCFEQAEKVYWLPTYLSREDPELPILTPQELTQNITTRDSIESAEMNDELWDHIQKARDEGKLVLCMGAGTIDGWIRERLKG